MHFVPIPSQFVAFLSILFMMFLTFTFWGMSPYLLVFAFIYSKADYFYLWYYTISIVYNHLHFHFDMFWGFFPSHFKPLVSLKRMSA